jgi:transcriptional regulator with XRE-family HTH domain
VPHPENRAGLFPALLKHWRRQRGLSQLDLALNADVSARHVSFLETGRSTPSPEMVLRLATTLGIPLRQVNAMLRAAGHDPVYDESDHELPPAVVDALTLLKDHHEPFPLVVVDHTYGVRDLNRAAAAFLRELRAGKLGRISFEEPGQDSAESVEDSSPSSG